MDIVSLPRGLKDNLEEGENILYAVKKKLSLEKPKWIVITDRRVIYFDEKVLGRYEMKSVPFEKLEKIYCRIGVIASRFVIEVEDSGRIELNWMDREESRKAITAVYNAIKSIAIEPPIIIRKKNIFSEEIILLKPKELIVRSMSTQSRQNVQGIVSEVIVEGGRRDPIALLRMLKELRDAGILTEEEYNEKKKKILEQL
jgi:hypothetical protein